MNYLKGHRTLTRLVELGILLVLPIIAHLFLPIMFLILSPYRYFGILLMVLGLIMAIWNHRCKIEPKPPFKMKPTERAGKLGRLGA